MIYEPFYKKMISGNVLGGEAQRSQWKSTARYEQEKEAQEEDEPHQ
jgi:hypothetical protein